MSVLTLCSTRSLGIHVVEVDAAEQALRSSWEAEYEVGGGPDQADAVRAEMEEAGKVSRKQLVLVYSLQLAEAIVAASLQSQLYVLLGDSQLCGSVNTAYWTGLVESIFALGSLAGLFWGHLGDRRGRRPIALVGILGLALSCFGMGFSNGLVSCALLRAFAGLMGSSIRVAVATMIGDVSHSPSAKARNFSRLPLVSTGGIIGPLLQAALVHRFSKDNVFWMRFPLFGSQMVCAALMLAVFAASYFLLEETLPRSSTGQHDVEKQPVSPYSHRRGSESSDESYGEQDSFLGRGRPVQQPSTPTPSGLQPIEFSAIFRAPSLMIILGAYSLLTLHSATFDQLLPLLGNAPTDTAGLGLPCSFTPLIVLLASTAASGVVYKSFPAAVSRIGLLQLFRACCFVFPMIYVATPLLSKLARSSQGGIIAAALASVFFKTLVTGSAQTLVAILATNASPDPYSLATIMGFVQCASGVRSLAVAGTAVAYAVGSGVSVWATNVGLWGTMTGVGAVGAAVAWFVRDHPAVSDYCGSLKWEVCYDSVFEEVGPKAEEV